MRNTPEHEPKTRPQQEKGAPTLRDLQANLPWTVHYHHDFRASPMSHKDFGHALLHVTKAAGKLAALVNDAEHGGCEFKPEDTDRYVADLVVCALRMANTCPGRIIDLQRAVVERIESKNEVTLAVAGEAGYVARNAASCSVEIVMWLFDAAHDYKTTK